MKFCFQPFRVPLPYSKIDQLNDDATKVFTKVGIFTQTKERSDLLINELNKLTAGEGMVSVKIHDFTKFSWCLRMSCVNSSMYAIFSDIIHIQFEAIQIDMALVTPVKTPALLESLVLKHYSLKPGDFMFLEWPKFTEDILVTSDRSAVISGQTCKYTIIN